MYIDEVVRGSMILDKGKLTWPPPKPVGPPATQGIKPKAIIQEVKPEIKALSPFKEQLRSVGFTTAAMTSVLALGKATNPMFMLHSTIFALGIYFFKFSSLILEFK